MRGGDVRSEALFSYLSCEARVPLDHPLRPIQKIVDEALGALTGEFDKLYAKFGRPSIPPEKLLRALLLQAFYSVRSERQLMEQLGYNLLFRWFVGLSLDAEVWDVTVFTKNRERLIAGDIASKFMAAVLNQEQVKALLSDDHFAVDGTLIEAWASMKSFRPKDGSGEPPAPGRNGSGTFTARSGATRRTPRSPIPMPDCIAKSLPSRKRGARSAGQAGVSGARSDGEPARFGGRHASDPGNRHGRAGGGARDGGGASRQSSDHARCRQGLRRGRVCGRSAGLQCDAACGAEHHEPAIGNRRPDDPPPRLCGQWAGAQAHRGGIRLDQGGRRLSQDPSPRSRPCRLDVHLNCHCLQPGSAAQAGGGRGVAMPGICPSCQKPTKSMQKPTRITVFSNQSASFI